MGRCGPRPARTSLEGRARYDQRALVGRQIDAAVYSPIPGQQLAPHHIMSTSATRLRLVHRRR